MSAATISSKIEGQIKAGHTGLYRRLKGRLNKKVMRYNPKATIALRLMLLVNSLKYVHLYNALIRINSAISMSQKFATRHNAKDSIALILKLSVIFSTIFNSFIRLNYLINESSTQDTIFYFFPLTIHIAFDKFGRPPDVKCDPILLPSSSGSICSPYKAGSTVANPVARAYFKNTLSSSHSSTM